MWRPRAEEECRAPAWATRTHLDSVKLFLLLWRPLGCGPRTPSPLWGRSGWALSRTVVSHVRAGTRGGHAWLHSCEGSLRGPQPSPVRDSLGREMGDISPPPW